MGFDALLAARRARPFEPLRVLGRALTGVVSWNVNDTCNYRCSYCTQRDKASRDYRLTDVDAYVAAFDALPGDWELKLSGGEPFQQPGLDELAGRLVARGHVVSIQTNFSAPEARLRAFLEATKGSLHVFSASLHLEYDTPERFLERLEIVRPYLAGGERSGHAGGEGATFNVTSVAVPARLEQLRDHVAPLFARHGVAFKVQPEKIHGHVRYYDEAQRAILRALGGHNRTGAIENSFRGRLCHAGAHYLVVKSSGRAYRCYPASRIGGRYAKLGSVAEGFRLLDGPHLCPYAYCGCTVPIQRHMMATHDGRRAPGRAPNEE